MNTIRRLPHIQTGERVAFLSGNGPNNRGVLFAIYPSITWGYSADVLWDSGERRPIARLSDLVRETEIA